PSDVSGLLAHVTIVQPQASGGYVILIPGDVPTPNASTVNPATAVAFNAWVTGVPTSGTNAGTFAIYSTNTLDVIVDVLGYWSPGSPDAAGNLTLINPTRVVDTRAGEGGPVGYGPGGSPITAGPCTPGTARRFLLARKTFGGL